MANPAMELVAQRLADRSVRSIFIYTNEAHPGEYLSAHDSMETKRSNAMAFRDEQSVGRQILLDDLQGACHLGFGGLPNMSWIIARGGMILYKAAWTRADDLEVSAIQALDGLESRRQKALMPAYTERLTWRAEDNEAFIKIAKRAGPQAIADMFGEDAAAAAFKDEPSD